ncbi:MULTISPECIES: GNAT family N-acetyltransferase [unclassified Bacillus (in: firmicutes)]|uniref:GNAT family N-acetyltransferase n=1 Tax=unclassified Bacillus (in: firmicutes) TaxID=185979 RepID=UPI001BE83EF1|nr:MULTISPECIES: GNAT family N-acetyltransferase [unclassified Bacillus (in: firmicutes)]MBT2638302.1 GNAT family N-acetyltransferase [Bacillus sp. ISL-39]MBT2661342.1 GNAT family N-acetyltransferase [Bacillus sp. ISL-45]
MDLKNVKLTKQMARALWIAEQECARTRSKCLLPVHLLIGCLDDGSFPVKESKDKSGIGIDSIRSAAKPQDVKGVSYEPFHFPVSAETKQVMEVSIGYMNSYNQVYLNEGHVLKSLMAAGHASGLLTEEQQQALLSIAVVSRDMRMTLSGYTMRSLLYQNIRKVTNDDGKNLLRFIEDEFSGKWVQSIKTALSHTQPAIFIATDSSDKIVGFAAYKTNGYFGPMGVALSRRSEGIGEALLHSCLDEMRLIGFKEVIIDQAGPIEFYERACNAQVIPINKL